MFNAPIYRRLQNESGTKRYPLFQSVDGYEPPINCLIIESEVDQYLPPVSGDIHGDGLIVRSLPQVRVEAEWVEDFLKTNKSVFGIGEIKRINKESCGPDGLLRTVERELTNGRISWHLIHYAGHCHTDGNTKKGYLVFPGEKYAEPVELEMFSTWLKDARFVYLSGCASSEEEFVFELAKSYVPAVFGFRWKVRDDEAPECAKSFYQNFFKGTRSLEYAFSLTQADMRKRFKERRIWANPMLILQFSPNAAPLQWSHIGALDRPNSKGATV
jgi:hypothetical protein